MTSNDSCPKLVPDILDFTLDQLHNDIKTLKRCALVSKSFLPTSQRHLFSKYRLSNSNISKLEELFKPSTDDSDDDVESSDPPTDAHDDKSALLRARVAYLLNNYTTELTLTIEKPRYTFENAQVPELKNDRLPGFENVQKIVFKGEGLTSKMQIPEFLRQRWTSPTSKILSVGFDVRFLSGRAIVESLYTLPAAVKNISFAIKDSDYFQLSSTPFCEDVNRWLQPVNRGPRQINGTLKLFLARDRSHEVLLSAIITHENLFEFNLQRLAYQLTASRDLNHLALLVDKCKNTLQHLDIFYSSLCPGGDSGSRGVQPFDFSGHHALRMIRIWTPLDFDPDWLRTAISSIPKPSSASPRVPPLRVELYISLPTWMIHLREDLPFEVPQEVDRMVTSWIPVDAQLWQLIGPSPEAASAKSLPGVTAAGITLDVRVMSVDTGPGSGIAALAFPLLSCAEGALRLF